MLRARRLVTLWKSSQPAMGLRAGAGVAHDTSLALLSGRLSRVQIGGAGSLALPQRRWMSVESETLTPPAASPEEDAKMQKLLSELDTCRDMGKWRQALKLLDRIDKDAELPELDAAMYERAIAACARMGKVEVLPGLMNNMLVDDIRPTSATVDFAVQAYLAQEQWGLIATLACEATAQSVPLSSAAFHAAMEACGQTNDAAAVSAIMQNLRESGASLTTAQYAEAIRAAGMSRRLDTARQLFVQMEERDGLVADPEVFNQFIRAQVVNRELSQALQSFASAAQRGLVLSESIHTATIDALVSKSEYWQATQLFEQMLDGGEQNPTVFCLGRAMAAYVGANKSQHAWACWRKITEMNERNPQQFKYSKILNELTRAKDTKLAVEVFEFMDRSFPPSEIQMGAYTTAIRAHGRLGNTQKAMDLFDQFVASREEAGEPLGRFAGIYLAAFNALSRDTQRPPEQNTRDAKRVWDLMAVNVPVVLAPAYASLAGVFASNGEMETLEELVEHAEASWRSSGAASNLDDENGGGELDLSAIFEDSADDAQIGLVEVVGDDEDSTQNDILLFNGVISGLSKARVDQTGNIELYLNTMRDRGLPVTESIVRAVTDACIRFGNWRLASRLRDYVDISALTNAEACMGDTVSKLLVAKAWEPAREWIEFANSHHIKPPVRSKTMVLNIMRESESKEWRIAYVLAQETMSYHRLVQANADGVASAAEVCMRADRPDLAVKLFDQLAGHSTLRSYRRQQQQQQLQQDGSATSSRGKRKPVGDLEPVEVPLSMYKNAVLALMRIRSTVDPQVEKNAEEADKFRMTKMERICAQMLQTHGKHLDGEALSLAISLKASVRDDDDVMALYQMSRTLGLEPNSYAQNAAIIAFSRQRRTDEVLAVLEDLKALRGPDGQQQHAGPHVTKALLKSLAIAKEDTAMLDAAHNLSGCTMDKVMLALMHSNRLETAVALLDEQVSLRVLGQLVERICDPKPQRGWFAHDPVLAAAVLLKYARLHGLAQLQPNRVLLVAEALLANNNRKEAEQLLQLYLVDNVQFRQMPVGFQDKAVNMLLVLFGERGGFEDMHLLFEKQEQMLAKPLSTAHYDVAMEYCISSRDELVGAVQGLKLFETLRRHPFVQPSGYSYLLPLRCCMRLDRLDSAGQVVLTDALENGFGRDVAQELNKQTGLLIAQSLGKKRKSHTKKNAEIKPSRPLMDPTELARLALFCHHNGHPLSTKLCKSLLSLREQLPVEMVNELDFVLQSLKNGLAFASTPATSNVGPKLNRRPKRESREPASGKRWGGLYLKPLPSEDDK